MELNLHMNAYEGRIHKVNRHKRKFTYTTFSGRCNNTLLHSSVIPCCRALFVWNQPLATNQQYFALRTNHYQPPAKRTRLSLLARRTMKLASLYILSTTSSGVYYVYPQATMVRINLSYYLHF
jgi:hypothetical protein